MSIRALGQYHLHRLFRCPSQERYWGDLERATQWAHRPKFSSSGSGCIHSARSTTEKNPTYQHHQDHVSTTHAHKFSKVTECEVYTTQWKQAKATKRAKGAPKTGTAVALVKNSKPMRPKSRMVLRGRLKPYIKGQESVIMRAVRSEFKSHLWHHRKKNVMQMIGTTSIQEKPR